MRGVFFEACRLATMSAASASICLSTSHSETTSTGATWISRNRSHLPYQPQPIRPTRLASRPAKPDALPASSRQSQAGRSRTGLEEFATIHRCVSQRIVGRSQPGARTLEKLAGSTAACLQVGAIPKIRATRIECFVFLACHLTIVLESRMWTRARCDKQIGDSLVMDFTPESSSLVHSKAGQKHQHFDGGRRLFVGLAVAFIVVLGMWIWAIRRADELPDIGDPFDVAEARRPINIRDTENAYVLYAEASRQHPEFPAILWDVDLKTLTWSKASASVREFVEKNRPALETWREASDRPEAIYQQPGDFAFGTVLRLLNEVRTMADLAALEGSRHEEAGRMDRAWQWYRAMLRASRHVGTHGVLVERRFGAQMHANAAGRILHWAADPRVDATLLRKALDETLAADAMTPPVSRCLKLGYLITLREIDELTEMGLNAPLPGGKMGLAEKVVGKTAWKAPIQRFRLRANNDVERSRRAARLLYANWLAQVDKLASKRAPIAIQKPLLLYKFDRNSRATAEGIDAEALDQALTHTTIAQEMFRLDDATQSSRWTVTMWESVSPLRASPGTGRY